jgi:competence ComEA-like helix-hairpin-helix protein
MTQSRDGVDPPFSKRSIQLTIAVLALTVSLWQLMACARLMRQNRIGDQVVDEDRRWGELSGSGQPLIQIDLNQAGLRELSLLPGVGPILARRIVENRRRLGPFESIEAMSRVHGIGSKTIEEIRVLGYVDRAPKPGRPTDPPEEGGVQTGS